MMFAVVYRLRYAASESFSSERSEQHQIACQLRRMLDRMSGLEKLPIVLVLFQRLTV